MNADNAAAEPVLEVENVSKRFSSGRRRSVVALDNVNIAVGRGEFVSLLGPSGCGKTTVFNMVAGLVTPTRGCVRIGGEDVTGRAGHVGYMLQKDLLLPWRTVIQNVTLGAQLLGRDVAAARREAHELFERFGMRGFEDAWPSQLSGGMRQRAAVMRTLLSGREILLLDEPFGALDAMTREAMQSWLLDVWQSFGSTVVFVTHDVDEAVFLSDRIVVMGARPGTVRREIVVDLPRPRSADDVATAARRASIKHEVLEVIHADGVDGTATAHGAPAPAPAPAPAALTGKGH